MNDTSWSYLKDWDLLINITDVLIDMGTYPVTRHDIAGIWVAFFQGASNVVAHRASKVT